MVHESSAREYVSGAREYVSGAREYVSSARECMSGACEWCTRVRVHGLVSKQPAVSSLTCVREVEANFNRLGMGLPGQTLVDWAWALQGKLKSTGHGTSTRSRQ